MNLNFDFLISIRSGYLISPHPKKCYDLCVSSSTINNIFLVGILGVLR